MCVIAPDCQETAFQASGRSSLVPMGSGQPAHMLLSAAARVACHLPSPMQVQNLGVQKGPPRPRTQESRAQWEPHRRLRGSQTFPEVQESLCGSSERSAGQQEKGRAWARST